MWGLDINTIYLAGSSPGHASRVWNSIDGGTTWSVFLDIPSDNQVLSIYGFSTANIYFANINGEVLWWHGDGLRTISAGDGFENATAVWGPAPGNVYWSQDIPSAPQSQVMHVVDNTPPALAENGPWPVNGGSNPNVQLESVFGSSATNILACGVGSTTLRGAQVYSIKTPRSIAPGVWERETLPNSANTNVLSETDLLWVAPTGEVMVVGKHDNGGGGQEPFSWLGIPGPSTVTIGSLSDVWAQDLIAVTFEEKLANDALLKSPQSYTVTALDGGSPVDVVSVQSGSDNNTATVWLVVAGQEIGKTYQITFSDMHAIDGSTAIVYPCNFIGRTTKEDSIINSRPSMYDMRPSSAIRIILQAIGRSDDQIGGSRNDFFTTPLPAPHVITVVVTPNPKTLLINANQTFTAVVDGGVGPQGCTWFVNDIPLGDSTVGQLTVLSPTSVKYTAPALVPTPATVTLKAVSDAWGVSGTAAITITVTQACAFTKQYGIWNTGSPAGDAIEQEIADLVVTPPGTYGVPHVNFAEVSNSAIQLIVLKPSNPAVGPSLKGSDTHASDSASVLSFSIGAIPPAAGDLLLATFAINLDTKPNTDPAITPPAGFVLHKKTRLFDVGTATGLILYSYYKIADGTEDPLAFTLPANYQFAGGVNVYTGVDNVTPFDAAAQDATQFHANSIAPTALITTTSDNDTLVYSIAATNLNATGFNIFTPAC
jgi:hypothetical protein